MTIVCHSIDDGDDGDDDDFTCNTGVTTAKASNVKNTGMVRNDRKEALTIETRTIFYALISPHVYVAL